MAREVGKLKPIAVPRIKATGMYSDGGGLYLQVRESTEDEPARSWIFRYAMHGKERYMGLGSLNTFSLAEARELARECRQKVSKGVDPLAAREEQRHATGIAAARNITFRQAAEEYIEAHQSGWRNAKHAAQWPATLETYAYPIIGTLSVQQIDAGLVRRVLEQIVTVSERDDSGAMVERRASFWHAKTETANRVRGRIESILARATALGYRTGDNPARWRGHLAEAFPRRSKVQKVEHHPALPYSEIGGFVEALRLREGIAPRALEFLILTACRSGEVIEARWREIDLDNKVWTIPAERMKAGREHRVPLSQPALAILRDVAARQHKKADFVFPSSAGDAPLSDMALLAVIRRMNGKDQPPAWHDKNGNAIVPHGFRSTFRDWASEQTNYPRDVAEAALAHAIEDKTEAAYRRGDLFEKRYRLMNEWARFCESSSTVAKKVVAINARP